jgi:hypothetical protein
MHWFYAVVFLATCLASGIIASRSGRVGNSFWKICAIVMVVDLLLYVLVFYGGRVIPPASPYTSFPGNYGLILGWALAHYPSMLIFHARVLPDSMMWILTLHDVWIAGLIYVWRRWQLRPGSATPGRAV